MTKEFENQVLSTLDTEPPQSHDVKLDVESVETTGEDTQILEEPEKAPEVTQDDEKEEPASSEENFMEGEIRCICGYQEDDGFTIQCERCYVWQHAVCVGISKGDVPDKYFCEKCNPRVLDVELAKSIQKSRIITATTPMTTPNRKPRGRPPTKKRTLDNEEPNNVPFQAVVNSTFDFIDEYSTFDELSDLIISEDAKSLYKELTHPGLSDFSMMDFHRLNDFSQLKNHSVELRRIRSRGFQKKTLPSKYGLFSFGKLDAGKLIMEYSGEFERKSLFGSEFSLNNNKHYIECVQPFVLFHPSLDIAIDARKYGNQARFIRRSCRPNAEVKIMLAEDSRTLKIGIFAKTMIVENEEILLEIDYEHGNSFFRYECACGTPEFCLASDPFKASDKLPNLLFNDHFYRGLMTEVLPNGSIRRTKLNESEVPKKRGRKKLDKLAVEQTSEGDSEEDNEGSEILSPNTSEQKKLSREERKIQAYMQSFQRLEQLSAKKQKKRGRPKVEEETPRKKDNRMSRIGRKKYLMNVYFDEQRKREALDHMMLAMDSINSPTQSPNISLESPTSVKSEFEAANGLTLEIPEIQTPVTEISAEVSVEDVSPSTPVAASKTRLSLSEYLLKRKSNSHLPKTEEQQM